jgi:hypothetical protein
MVSDQDSREVILQAAISDLNDGVFTSVRACAKAYNVPRSTLSDRLAHRPTRSMARQQQQRLSPEQEDFIVAWIHGGFSWLPAYPRQGLRYGHSDSPDGWRQYTTW